MTNVLLLTRYERLGASSRVRFLQFLPALEREGFTFDVRPLLDNDYVRFALWRAAGRRGEHAQRLLAAPSRAAAPHALRRDLAREGSAAVASDLAGNRAAAGPAVRRRL